MSEPTHDSLGANAWLVDEMFERYRDNPQAVSEIWREFFVDYQPPGPVTVQPPTSPAGNGATVAANDLTVQPTAEVDDDAPPGTPIKGVAARIVENMERSLDVPTATSYREVAAKLLEINRSVINGHLGRTRGGKVSFTHIIGYAIVRAIADHLPRMNSSFIEGPDGEPRLLRPDHVTLGLAIDIEKRDGSRNPGGSGHQECRHPRFRGVHRFLR